MMDTENRHITRDSLFVLVDLRIDGEAHAHRIKMRNLSAGGMMGEGDVPTRRGMIVWTNLKEAGWVEGTVAWVQDKRFGIAFRHEIDSDAARAVSREAPQLGDYQVRKPAIFRQGRSEGPVRTI